jgi:hypothetical protein
MVFWRRPTWRSKLHVKERRVEFTLDYCFLKINRSFLNLIIFSKRVSKVSFLLLDMDYLFSPVSVFPNLLPVINIFALSFLLLFYLLFLFSPNQMVGKNSTSKIPT